MRPMYTGPADEEPDERDVGLLRYERERGERIARRNEISWKIVGWVMAAALALLAYDAGGAALDTHRSGRPWLYPAAVSVLCLVILAGLGVRAARRYVAARRREE